jgi:hypothetical protein
MGVAAAELDSHVAYLRAQPSYHGRRMKADSIETRLTDGESWVWLRNGNLPAAAWLVTQGAQWGWAMQHAGRAPAPVA